MAIERGPTGYVHTSLLSAPHRRGCLSALGATPLNARSMPCVMHTIAHIYHHHEWIVMIWQRGKYCTMECTTRRARWLCWMSFSAVFRTICRTSDVILNHCCLRRPSLSYHHCLHCKRIRSSLHPASVFVIFNNPESLLRKAKPHPHLQFPTCTFGVKPFYVKY